MVNGHVHAVQAHPNNLACHGGAAVQHHLDTATSEFALSMMASMMPDIWQQPAPVQPAAVASRRPAAAAGDEVENVPPYDDAHAEDGVLQVMQLSLIVEVPCGNAFLQQRCCVRLQASLRTHLRLANETGH